jgi:hypothetical protein
VRLGVICAAFAANGCHDWDSLDRVWPPACDSTLVSNGDFEQGTQGWEVNSSATLTQGPGHGGGHAAHVCSGPGASRGPYHINDFPPTVPSTAAGEVYLLTLWVQPGATTEKIRVNLSEQDSAGNQLAGSSRFAPATADWTSVVVTHPISHPGNELTIEVLDTIGGANMCFDLDDVCLNLSP